MKLTSILAILTALFAFIANLFRNKLKAKEAETDRLRNEIELVKENERIKTESDNINFTTLSERLRKAKGNYNK